jgi:hypothetical protein
MPDLSEHLLTAPSVRQWLGRLRQAVGERRCAVLLLPDSVEAAGIWDALRLEVERIRGEWPVEIDLSECPAGVSPHGAFAAALGLDRSAGITLESALTASTEPDVIVLKHIEQLPVAARNGWFEFIAQAAALSQRLAGQRRVPCFICLGRGENILDGIPSTDARLAIEWWWGLPSVTETRVLLRAAEDGSDSVREAYREHVLPSLAGADLDMAEFLWDDIFNGRERIEQRLVEYAGKRGWSKDRLQSLGLERRPLARRALAAGIARVPPLDLRRFWANGLVNQTAEYGVELNTAALACVDRREAVAHRVWRGETALLLPLLDALRLDLCTLLARDFGPNWPEKLGWPQDQEEQGAVREDPYSAQWGYLYWLFRSAPPLRKAFRLVQLSSQAWWIRNELAHYRPVAFGPFRQLCDYDHAWRREPA